MKIRLTLLTENDKQRPPELTEEKVKAAWQAVVNTMCLLSDSDDTCVVEKAEFIEEVIPEQTEQKRGIWIKDCNVAFYWKCSECGAYLFWRKEDYLLRENDNPNYCPNCGAKMV